MKSNVSELMMPDPAPAQGASILEPGDWKRLQDEIEQAQKTEALLWAEMHCEIQHAIRHLDRLEQNLWRVI